MRRVFPIRLYDWIRKKDLQVMLGPVWNGETKLQRAISLNRMSVCV